MLTEIETAYILFEDASETKVIWLEEGTVRGAGMHGQVLELGRDYHVFSRTREGFDAMRDRAWRLSISRSKGDAVLVDSQADMLAWVQNGDQSRVRTTEAKPPVVSTTESDQGLFSGCDPAFKASLLDDQGDNDLSDSEEWQALQGKTTAGEQRHIPHNRIKRWPFRR